VYKGNLRRCGEEEARLQGGLHSRWHSAPSLSTDCCQARQEEQTNVSYSVRRRPRREVHRGYVNELGELPRQ
jgi:hypothetical protein